MTFTKLSRRFRESEVHSGYLRPPLRLSNAVFLATVVVLGPGMAAAQSQAMTELVESKLVPLGKEALVVEWVRAENEQGKTADQLEILDEGWRMTEGVPDFMRGWIDNECGHRLQEVVSQDPAIELLWVTDRLGANVAMTDRVPIYWHGKEEYFSEAYRSGAGGVFIGDATPDPTTGRSMATACAPVVGHGVAIGVVCAIIDVNGLEGGSS
jgi:hypothetical protein